MSYSGPLPQVVPGGGTGAATLTGVLTGNGASAITATAVTQHDVLVGAASNAVASIAPSATSGVPLISQGASSDPAFGTVVVAGGGTGAVTLTGLLTGNGTSAITATAITQYNVLSGGASNAPNSIAPSATSGVPLISQGSSSQPIFGTAVVAGGGTGSASFTAYGPVVAAATTTGALTSVTPSATSGIPFVSGGSSANPSFTTAVVAGGGTGLTSATAYAVICGGTTSTAAFQSIASVGTSGYVLTSNGAGALPTFQAVAAGGKLILIQRQTTAGTTALTFTTGITNTYNNYLLVISNYTQGTAGKKLQMQVSTDGGATYISTNYLSGVNTIPYNSSTLTNANSTSGMVIFNGVATTAPQGSALLLLSNVTNGNQMTMSGSGTYNVNSGTLNSAQIYACYNSNATINAFQLTTNSAPGDGNIIGTFTLFGILES